MRWVPEEIWERPLTRSENLDPEGPRGCEKNTGRSQTESDRCRYETVCPAASLRLQKVIFRRDERHIPRTYIFAAGVFRQRRGKSRRGRGRLDGHEERSAPPGGARDKLGSRPGRPGGTGPVFYTPPGRCLPDQSVVVGPGECLRTAVDLQLLVDARQVIFDRSDTEVQFVGNLPVGRACCENA